MIPAIPTAIQRAEQWRKEGACGEAAKVAIALLNELESLRAEVREWLCENCNTVYPGPPLPGLTCVVCSSCGGTTGPRGIIERKKLQDEQIRTPL
ncbi:hypothetical protein ACIPEN_14440 [Herbaspirillum chlorophenolicum]|uniref:Uncharacterized protein n=1 Tax=Herbaspirillum chlorophenolicum TaxID=211589 RepID=A0ABW8F156_9BURK